MPPSRYKQKNQNDINWLRTAGYSAQDSEVIVNAQKTAFLKKSQNRLIEVCQLDCVEIAAVLGVILPRFSRHSYAAILP